MSTVSIVKLVEDNVDESVRRAVEMAGGFKDLISDKYVLIKPNVFKSAKSGTGLITDARVTEAVTKLVLECSPRRVVIGEGRGVGYLYLQSLDTMEPFKESGTMEVAERLGVELIDLNKDEKVEVDVPDALVMKKFRVAKTALESDVRISVPVLKTHRQATITCSLKNMKGVLPGFEKRLTHRLGLERALVDLNRIVKPHFTIVDAMRVMQGMWSYPEDTVEMGLILAGSDPVALDSVCSRLMGLDPSKIQYLSLAHEAGLGILDTSKIDVVGERPEDVGRKFLPFTEALQARYRSVELIEKNACTGCIGEISNSLGFLKLSGLTKIGDLKLIVGTPDVIPEEGEMVIVGICAEKFKEAGIYVPGCPPHGREIALAVSKKLNLDENKLLGTLKNM